MTNKSKVSVLPPTAPVWGASCGDLDIVICWLSSNSPSESAEIRSTAYPPPVNLRAAIPGTFCADSDEKVYIHHGTLIKQLVNPRLMTLHLIVLIMLPFTSLVFKLSAPLQMTETDRDCFEMLNV